MRRRTNLRPTFTHLWGGTLIAAILFAATRCSTTFTVPGTPETGDAGLDLTDGSDGSDAGPGHNPDGAVSTDGAARDGSGPPLADGGPGHTDGGGAGVDAAGPRPVDAGPADAGTAYVTFVNATGDMTDLGLCFGMLAGATTLVAATTPNVLAIGTAGGAPWTFSGSSLSNDNVAVYGVDLTASPGLATTNCSSIIESNGAANPVYASAVWSIGTIRAGSFPGGSGFAVLVSGCKPGETTSAANCGAGYNSAISNLSLFPVHLDSTTPVPSGYVGVQFLQGSAAWATVADSVGATGTAGIVATYTADAGFTNPNFFTGQANSAQGTLSPNTAYAFAGLASQWFAAQAVQPDGTSPSVDGGDINFADAIYPNTEAFTWGMTDAGVIQSPSDLFASGTNWTFVLLGDPMVATYPSTGVVDLRGPHFVIARNKPL